MNLEGALEKIAKLEEEVKRYKEIEKRYIEMTGWVIPCGQEFDRSSFPELKAPSDAQVFPDSKLIFERTKQLVKDRKK